MDVKDTVHKAPLMLHLVELVVDKFPESSDLYSELSHVHRIAKVSSDQPVNFSKVPHFTYIAHRIGLSSV